MADETSKTTTEAQSSTEGHSPVTEPAAQKPQPAGVTPSPQAAPPRRAVAGMDLGQLLGGQEQSGAKANLDLIMDIEVPISVELGRTEKPIGEVLELGPGSIVELDKMASDPVDLLVNGKLIARGEVVVVDENFGIRITSVVDPRERVKSLG